jgi:poly(U)-specific endoribonuclease
MYISIISASKTAAPAPKKTQRVSVKPTREELGDFGLAAAKLWKLDLNRLTPNVDYKINLQRGTRPYTKGDHASHPLFTSVTPSVFRSHPTFSAFFRLLDNYERSTGVAETVTNQEKKENQEFIRLCCQTAPMAYVHRYLATKKLAPPSTREFARLLDKLWFALYRRGTRNDSCGFEHVFVGEERDGKVMGMHNWIQLCNEEKVGRLDYRGYIPPRNRRSPKPDEDDQIVTIQFAWEGDLKPVSTSFIGVSPEFELALYTLAFLGGQEDNFCCLDGEHELNIKCYSIGHGHGRKIGTAFPELR